MTKIEEKIEIRTFDHGSEDPTRHLPIKYQNSHVSKLKLENEVMQKVRAWVENCNTFLVFLGRAGCGKTYFSCAMARYIWEKSAQRTERDVYNLVHERNDKGTILSTTRGDILVGKRIDIHHPEVAYYSVNQLYDEFKKLYSSNESDISIKCYLNNVNYLIIDDLGATSNTEWQIQTIYEVLDFRYSNQLPTIVTSNFHFDEIEKIFHSRIRSRLEDEINLCIYDWDTDMRTDGLRNN